MSTPSLLPLHLTLYTHSSSAPPGLCRPVQLMGAGEKALFSQGARQGLSPTPKETSSSVWLCDAIPCVKTLSLKIITSNPNTVPVSSRFSSPPTPRKALL